MPSFLKDLRRFSNSKPKDKKSSSSSNGSNSNHSSSTLNTGLGSVTPPTLPSESSSSQLPSINTNGGPPPVPRRPTVHSSKSNRYSLVGSPTAPDSASPSPPRPQAPTSPFAPRILSISDGSWVHQQVLLVYGQIADPATQPIDGQLWICHHQDLFPATAWPVCDSHFKALVYLQPGPNRLRLDFVSPKVQGPNGQVAHSSWININYLPLNSAPPLDLVILLGKDSPGTFDAVPERKQREGNGLETARRKFKMAAYLWQAFTGEQMQRNAFGRRCFRFEEEWQPGTLSCHDSEGTPQMRNEAKIHVIRSEKTVAQIRDLDIAQQYEPAQRKHDLYDIAMDAVKGYFQPRPGQIRYVSVLILDTHWDPSVRVVRGHAALGGGDDSIKLAIFGSHALQSYPTCIEEIVPAFTDCTRTDMNYVANDLNESGSNWEAANIGIGAHMHETGHLLGCPHQENGVMLRDYVRLNRTFTCREPFSTRTKSQGRRLCLPADECAWHRLDCLRFRFHPCFKVPSDLSSVSDESVQVWAMDNGTALVTAAAGIAWIELFTEGDDVCRSHIEYLDGPSPPKQITLSEADLRSRLPPEKQRKKLKIEIFAAGQGKHTVDDFSALVSKSSKVRLPNGQTAFRGGRLGASQQEGSRPQEVHLLGFSNQKQLLTAVRVYAGFALDGIEFVYEDSSTQMFGNRGGKPGGYEFKLDIRRGEQIMGFHVRAGLWIDGIQILTSSGRRSDFYGNPNGGSGIAGVSGSCGQWVDGFELIITR